MDDDRSQLLSQWRTEAVEPFQGWDFSHLEGRMSEDSPPWSYPEMAAAALRDGTRGLDLGTGGGEFLTSLADDLPATMVATEGWQPNVDVASANLAPLGIDVVVYDSESDPAMPFPNRCFDVILSRHESYDANEIARVLEPGGLFVTQQVDGRNLIELVELFGAERPYLHVTLENACAAAVAAGLEMVHSREFIGSTTFTDVGALVYYLSAIPWEVPDDFGVDRYQDQLFALHASGPAQGKPIKLTLRLFYLMARSAS